MIKETDVKSLGIFGNNSGLDKIREAAEKKKKLEENKVLEKYPYHKEKNTSKNHTATTNKKKRNIKNAGAPIRQFDRIYAAKLPLKLSALLNSTSRNLVEKYETSLSRDELLRTALDEYIKQHLSLEDKHELYQAVLRDLELFREKHPTIPQINKNKEIIKTIEDIEKETEYELKRRWGIK